MRILLVDDNSEMRGAARELLEAQGHQVVEASRGEEALDLAESRELDLLMTDLDMPGIDGIELADRLAERTVDRGVPIAVVLFSSDSGYPGLRERILAGGMAFLRKPFSAAELAAEIDSALARKATLAGLAAGAPGVLSPAPQPAPVGAAAPARVAEPAVTPVPAAARARPGWRPQLWQLAASIALVLAAGGALRTLVREPPPLSAPPATSVRRGAEVEVVEPRGTIHDLPTVFRWRGAEDADHYRVTLRGVDDRVLWSGRAEGTWLEPPPQLTAELRPAVAYTWTVEAADADGGSLARSSPVAFRIAASAAVAGESS